MKTESTSEELGDQIALYEKSKGEWERYWQPASLEEAVKKLLEKIQLEAIYEVEQDQGKPAIEAARHVVKSIVPQYPDNVLAYKKIKGNTERTAIWQVQSGLRIVPDFKKYYPGTSGVFYVVLVLLGIVCGSISWIYIKYILDIDLQTNSGAYGVFLGLIFFLPPIIGYIQYSHRVRPSKWHWFDVLAIAGFPLVLMVVELNTNAGIYRLFNPGAAIGSLMSYYQFYILGLFLFSIGVIGLLIAPCSLKGQLLYAAGTFETAAKVGGGRNVRQMAGLLRFFLTALNDVLSAHFELEIENVKEIQETFSKNLLKGGTAFLPTIKVVSTPELLQFFATGLLPAAAKRKRLNKDERRQLQNIEYTSTLDSIHLLIEQIESFTTETQVKLKRVTLKDKLVNQFQKIIAIGSGVASVLVSLLSNLFFP